MKFLAILIGVFILFIAAMVATLFLVQQGILGTPPRLNATVVLERIQKMSKLVTTRYSYSSMVTSERDMPGILAALYGEKLAMVAVGYVTAGVDLSTLTQEDVTFENGVLSLNLPAPTLQDCFLNEQQSYVVSYATGIFARNMPNMDADARRFAVHQFRDSALESGILNEAQDQAKVAIEEFVNLVSVGDVKGLKLTQREPNPEVVLPESCA
jgi:hypothetical protein